MLHLVLYFLAHLPSLPQQWLLEEFRPFWTESNIPDLSECFLMVHDFSLSCIYYKLKIRFKSMSKFRSSQYFGQNSSLTKLYASFDITSPAGIFGNRCEHLPQAHIWRETVRLEGMQMLFFQVVVPVNYPPPPWIGKFHGSVSSPIFEIVILVSL
jgi:hypothetical protein